MRAAVAICCGWAFRREQLGAAHQRRGLTRSRDVRQAARLTTEERYPDIVPRRHSDSHCTSGPRSVTSLISQVQFNLNWQWPAIKMQYERLKERSRLPPERMLYEHMQMVADMDFLVIMARRFLRTAEQARQIPSQHQPQLKLAIKAFYSRWGNLTAVRNALEHSDATAMFPVPAASFHTAEHSSGQFVFMWPGGNVDLGKLYEDAQSLLKAILKLVEPPGG